MSVEFRRLTEEDAPLLVAATGRETGRALWDRTPTGPYSLPDARAALAKWTEDTSYGVFENCRLVAAVGLMPDAPDSASSRTGSVPTTGRPSEWPSGRAMSAPTASSTTARSEPCQAASA